MKDGFEKSIPQEVQDILLALGGEFHFDPLSSPESKAYFCGLLEGYRGDPAETTAYLWTQVRQDFRYFEVPPAWIQKPEWPFHSGRPMYFVGQLDNTVRRDGFAYALMFYVFWDPEDGTTQTITQSD